MEAARRVSDAGQRQRVETNAAIPDFSPLAETYARARPRYPDELYAWISSQVPRRELAWDAATGNGQAAVGLARHFARVVATDISPGQIAHAEEISASEQRRLSRRLFRIR